MERFTPDPIEGVDYLVNRDNDETESGAERMYREMQNYKREQERLQQEQDRLVEDGYAIK